LIRKPNNRRPSRYEAVRDANAAILRNSAHRKPTKHHTEWSLPLRTVAKWAVAAAAIAYIVQTIISRSP
jgi:hypothetical protein